MNVRKNKKNVDIIECKINNLPEELGIGIFSMASPYKNNLAKFYGQKGINNFRSLSSRHNLYSKKK